ncbi:MAG: lysophospholipid acyltransferase family protein [Candidatus Omnitrophica bacterium]|nr:lysophospholipid acyltransferase family protein [Candidatus Omnitrophota bacterium]
MLRFLLYKIGQWIVNFLPLQVAYAFARCLSDLQYAVSFVDRRNVRANICKILNQDKVDEKLVRDVFRNFGRYLVEFFRMVKDVDDSFIAKKVKCEGLDHMKEVLARGKGAIVVTAHIGNWELGGNVMRKLGFPVLAVALPHKHNLVNDLFNQQREKCGISVVSPQNAVRKFLEKLKENESVALVADRDFGTHGVVMNFLGYPTLLPKGPAVLSIKTGAGIIPSFFLYNEDGGYTLSFYPPVYPPVVGDQIVSDDVLKTTISRYITVVEEKIRRFPGQWLMFREFWIK